MTLTANTLTDAQKQDLGQIIIDWCFLKKSRAGFINTTDGQKRAIGLFDTLNEKLGIDIIAVDASSFTDEQKDEFGEIITSLLNMKKSCLSRYFMYGGDKTNIGVFATLNYRFKLHLAGDSQLI